MKQFKKVFCLIAVCMFVVLSVTGCALFERDVEYYNNLIVATVGADIKITKKQLVDAYSNYGYQYVTEYGYTTAKALDATLDVLIDREIMVELAIQNFSFTNLDSADKTAKIKNLRNKKGMESLYYQALTTNEKAQVRKSAFDALDNSLKGYEDTVRSERNQSDKTTESADETASSSDSFNTTSYDAFTPYEAFITRAGNNTVFTIDISKYVEQENYYTLNPNYIEGSTDEDTKDQYICTVPERWSQKIRNEDDAIEKSIAQRALNRLVTNLKNAEKGLKYSDNSNEAIIDREINRMIEAYAKNILVERFEACFDQGISAPIDRESSTFKTLVVQYGSEDKAYEAAVAAAALDTNSTRAEQLKNQAIEYYKYQVKYQVNRYMKGLDDDDSLGEAIIKSGETSGLDGVYWLPSSMIDNYFTVSHILISYSDAQKAEIEKLKTDLGAGYRTTDEYAALLRKFESQVSGKERDENGNEIGDAKTAKQILSEIQGAIGGFTPSANASVADIQNRIKVFRDYIYKYNTDPGMLNPEYEYVMGVDKSGMVDSFTNASRELYGYKKVAKTENGEYVMEDDKIMYEWKKVDNFTAQKSSVYSELVMSEYGAHIIMYTRPVRDFIFTTGTSFNLQSLDSQIEGQYSNYLYAPLTSYGDVYLDKNAPAKTVFDVVVDKLNKPAYSNYENGLISVFKQNSDNKIKINKSNYKDLK